MILPLSIIVTLLFPYKVSGLTLTVQTNYFEIGGSDVTLECNLDGAAWDINTTPRLWKVPPNTMTVINHGSANTGYSEDLSDVATSRKFRMTTPALDWNIENELFQCAYLFDTASLNATRDILARNSGSSVNYDDTAKKCVFTINEILPSPSKVITLVQGSGQSDISSDFSKVTETLAGNNDQGQTYRYRLEVASKDLSDGDEVIFQVTAGPYSMNESCKIPGQPCDTTCKIIICVSIYVLGIVAVLIVLAIAKKLRHPCPCHQEYTGIGCRSRCVIIATSLGMGIIVAVVILIVLGKEKKLPCCKGSQNIKPDSGNSGMPRTESGNATNQGNETKDPSPKTDDKERHKKLPPLTDVPVEDGAIVLNRNQKIPDIPSKKSS